MHRRTAKVLDSLNGRRFRFDKRSDRADDISGGALPAGDGQPPQMVVLIPLPRCDFAVQLNQRTDVIAISAMIHIGLHLRAFGENA